VTATGVFGLETSMWTRNSDVRLVDVFHPTVFNSQKLRKVLNRSGNTPRDNNLDKMMGTYHIMNISPPLLRRGVRSRRKAASAFLGVSP
jgi:hypothetical protein